MELITIRETFSHMGAKSGYDLLFDNFNFPAKKIDFFRSDASLYNVELYKEALATLGVDINQYKLKFGFLATIKSRIIKTKPTYDHVGIFKKVQKIYDTVNYMYYNELSSFFVELQVFDYLLKNRETKIILHFSYIENQFGLFSSASIKKIFPNLKIVASVHQPTSWWKLYGKNRLIKTLDTLVVLSEYEQKQWSKICDFKVEYIPHGIKIDFFKPINNKKESREFTCVFSGNWLRDIDLLADVIEETTRVDSEIKFKIILPDAARQMIHLREPLFRMARNENVTWYSNLSDEQLLTHYQNSDVLLIPLIDCVANNAILEGTACGLPVVTSDLESLYSYVDDTFAHFVKCRDINEYVTTILNLKNNPDQRIIKSELARSSIEKMDWKNIQQKMFNLYQTL